MGSLGGNNGHFIHFIPDPLSGGPVSHGCTVTYDPRLCWSGGCSAKRLQYKDSLTGVHSYLLLYSIHTSHHIQWVSLQNSQLRREEWQALYGPLRPVELSTASSSSMASLNSSTASLSSSPSTVLRLVRLLPLVDGQSPPIAEGSDADDALPGYPRTPLLPVFPAPFPVSDPLTSLFLPPLYAGI